MKADVNAKQLKLPSKSEQASDIKFCLQDGLLLKIPILYLEQLLFC